MDALDLALTELEERLEEAKHSADSWPPPDMDEGNGGHDGAAAALFTSVIGLAIKRGSCRHMLGAVDLLLRWHLHLPHSGEVITTS